VITLRRPLRALQVEPSSRCTRSCVICPRTVLADRWQAGNLDTATWTCLRPDLRMARHVHLQGWGEPLLHPDLPEMVRDARAARCRVGITTNGDLLDDHIAWIVDAAVDLLAVSVAGDDSAHARLRDGSALDRLWRSLAALARHRRSSRPRLQVAYLLTTDTAGDLPEVVHAAARAGVDEVFVTHLDVTPDPGLVQLAAFTPRGLRPGIDAQLGRAAEAARSAGIAFREPARQPEELLVCALDPTRFAFVTWRGRVAPCVNLGLPVTGAIPRFVDGDRLDVSAVSWGDLREQRLRAILDSDKARRFRAPFTARRAAEQRFLCAQHGWGVPALRRLERTARQREKELAATPFPAPCQGCHKACGW